MRLVKGTDDPHGELGSAGSASRYCGVAHDEHIRVEDASVYAEMMAAEGFGTGCGGISANTGLQQA